MTLSTTEIIKSKKCIFIILSVIIFVSGVAVGGCITTVVRFRLFHPMREFHMLRETFIDNTAALAATPEKEDELKDFIKHFFIRSNKMIFEEIQKKSLTNLFQLQTEVEKRLPEAKAETFKKYVENYKQELQRFRPPPPRR